MQKKLSVVLEAAKSAKSLILDVICINNDAKNPISYLRNKNNQISRFSSSILDDSLFILNNFSFHEVRNVSRNSEFLSLADSAAKHCRKFRRSEEWKDIVPSFLDHL